MRARWISILVLLCLLLGSSKAQAQADPVNEVIQRVNALRAIYGVPEYQVDYALMVAAQAQAEWCLANDHFGHDGPGGSMPDDRAKAAGYGSGENSFAIENVAAGTASLNTPELVVTMWQGDWGHLNAMISADYEHIGVGFAQTDDFSFYVMMVGWVGARASSGSSPDQDIPEIITPLSPFMMSEPDEHGAIYHEVQPGQTAWTIAAQYGLELAELFELNQLTEDSILHPGDVLVIRPPDSASSTVTVTLASAGPTGIPTNSPLAEQVPEEDMLSHQDQDDHSNDPGWSDVSLVLLIGGLGWILLTAILIVKRFRQR